MQKETEENNAMTAESVPIYGNDNAFLQYSDSYVALLHEYIKQKSENASDINCNASNKQVFANHGRLQNTDGSKDIQENFESKQRVIQKIYKKRQHFTLMLTNVN